MNRTIELQIKDNVYSVTYPNTGQQIDLELMKIKIADGSYDALRFSNNPLFQQQADVVDMIATFSILVPKLKEDLNTTSLFTLKEEETEELMEVYRDQFLPWYVGLKQSIKKPKEVARKEEERKE